MSNTVNVGIFYLILNQELISKVSTRQKCNLNYMLPTPKLEILLLLSSRVCLGADAKAKAASTLEVPAAYAFC